MPGSNSTVWKNNLVVLGAGQLVTISAMNFVIPLIPFILRDLGMSDPATLERWSGLVFSGPFLAAALMSPVWGYLGDRFGHKKMVVRAIVGLAVVNLLLAWVRTPGQFLTIRLLQGLVTGFVPAALAITAASTPGDRVAGAMGRLAATSSAGRLIGPAIGGLLAGLMAFRQLFLLVGAIIGCAAVYVAIFLKEPPRPSTASSRVSFSAPLWTVTGDTRLRLAMFGLLATMAGISMTMPLFPLYVEEICPAGTDPIVVTGIGFATVAGFAMVGSALLGAIAGRVGLKRLLVVSLVVTAVSLALHPVAGGIASMLVLRAILGLAVAGTGPVLHAMISRASPEGMRGGVTGIANAATILGFFVGPIVGGWLANRFGVDGVFRFAATLVFTCGVLAAVVARQVGRDREIPAVPRDLPR